MTKYVNQIKHRRHIAAATRTTTRTIEQYSTENFTKKNVTARPLAHFESYDTKNFALRN